MGTPSYYGYVTFAAVYQDVDQTTTVRNGAAPSISGTSATPSVATASADFAAGDQGGGVGCGGCDTRFGLSFGAGSFCAIIS